MNSMTLGNTKYDVYNYNSFEEFQDKIFEVHYNAIISKSTVKIYSSLNVALKIASFHKKDLSYFKLKKRCKIIKDRAAKRNLYIHK